LKATGRKLASFVENSIFPLALKETRTKKLGCFTEHVKDE